MVTEEKPLAKHTVVYLGKDKSPPSSYEVFIFLIPENIFLRNMSILLKNMGIFLRNMGILLRKMLQTSSGEFHL